MLSELAADFGIRPQRIAAIFALGHATVHNRFFFLHIHSPGKFRNPNCPVAKNVGSRHTGALYTVIPVEPYNAMPPKKFRNAELFFPGRVVWALFAPILRNVLEGDAIS